MRQKFDKALRNLKNENAVGVEGMQAELWKELGEKIKNELI